jgi:hypothetical protein
MSGFIKCIFYIIDHIPYFPSKLETNYKVERNKKKILTTNYCQLSIRTTQTDLKISWNQHIYIEPMLIDSLSNLRILEDLIKSSVYTRDCFTTNSIFNFFLIYFFNYWEEVIWVVCLHVKVDVGYIDIKLFFRLSGRPNWPIIIILCPSSVFISLIIEKIYIYM